jgi:hypothetical protein
VQCGRRKVAASSGASGESRYFAGCWRMSFVQLSDGHVKALLLPCQHLRTFIVSKQSSQGTPSIKNGESKNQCEAVVHVKMSAFTPVHILSSGTFGLLSHPRPFAGQDLGGTACLWEQGCGPHADCEPHQWEWRCAVLCKVCEPQGGEQPLVFQAERQTQKTFFLDMVCRVFPNV